MEAEELDGFSSGANFLLGVLPVTMQIMCWMGLLGLVDSSLDGIYESRNLDLNRFRNTKAEKLRSYMNVKKSSHLYQGSSG